MNAAELIKLAAAEGVTIGLSSTGAVKASGSQLVVDKWLPKLRSAKEDVLVELRKESLSNFEKNGKSAWMWQVFLSGRTLIVTTSPSSTWAEMIEMYPSANSLIPLEE